MTALSASTSTTSQKRAREIMKGHYLGIEEVTKYYGRMFRRSQLERLREIPLSEQSLETYFPTHILVAGSTMTVLDVRRKAPRDPEVFTTSERIWYDEESFAIRACVRPQWYLIRKGELVNSIGKTMAEQESMLSSDETVPRACDLVYAVLLHFLATGERLFENVYSRCCDVDSKGGRVYVGHFDTSLGLRVNAGLFRDMDRRNNLGIATLRIV